MRKTLGIKVTGEALNLHASVALEQGALAQVYDKGSNSYSPDRTVIDGNGNHTNGIIASALVTGSNPNTQKDFTAKVTSVRWYVRYAAEANAADTEAGSDTTADVYAKDNKLYFNRNIPQGMSGVEIWARVEFTDANDDKTASQTMDTQRVALTTQENTITALSLTPEYSGSTDYPYAGNGYAVNPIAMPLTDADAWKRHVRCQLYDGDARIADAHEGTKVTGNGFYFWSYLGAGGDEIPLTGDEEWFSCDKYSDGTYAKECTVDLSKVTNVTLLCRAGYCAYGELSDVTNEDGTISRSRLEYSGLMERFSLSVRMPVLQRIYDRVIDNGTLKRSQFATPDKVHIRKQLIIVAGGMTVNEYVNPVTKKREAEEDGSVLYFDETAKLAYSDAVRRCYDITWYKDDGESLTPIGTGEFLDKTLTELGATGASNLPSIVVEVKSKTEDLFGNNYCVGYDASSDDAVPIEVHGNKSFLRQLDFMLYQCDTGNENDDGTYNASLLQRNNLLRYVGGGYAPVVGITSEQEAECEDNALYSDPGCATVAYEAGKYNAVTEWEQHDKPLMAAGGKPRTLYKKAGDGTISEVSHKLRPWETTRTDLSIGAGYTFPVYLLDQVRGDSGKVWKGIFTAVTEWDGIDLTPYRLEPTAMSPGAFTTIGGKARDFMYLYRPSDTNSQGTTANGISVFDEDRAYPRHADVHQVSSMTYCRGNNKDTTAPYPMAEGGFFCLDTLITALELMAGTKYFFAPDLYGSGISSNDGVKASSFFKVGGVKYKKASDSAYTYNTWSASVQTPFGLSSSTSWSAYSNGEAPKEQCMEAQMAASMAVELGIEPTTASGSENYYYFYGNKYYYMAAGSMATPADGQLNCRVYKAIDTTHTANSSDFEIHFLLRMSLYAGLTLSGDIYRYCGGGAELVAKAQHTRDDDKYGNPVAFWLQPSQKEWKRITSVQVAADATFGFEDSYLNLIADDGSTVTVSNNWRKNRTSYTPFAVDNSSGNKGDCMYVCDENWYDTGGSGKRTRLALRFGVNAHNGNCAPRSLNCNYTASDGNRNNGGRAQALVRLAQ